MLLSELPAISLEGAKGVGKTETARRCARTRFELDRPGVLDVVQADPDRLTAGEEPILIDEWQRYPASWNLVRRAVDDDPRSGRFILTGSVSHADPATHTGAGRIATVRMRPLTLSERGVIQPTVSMAELLTGSQAAVAGTTDEGLAEYVIEILSGGFPGMRRPPGRAHRALLGGYVDRIVDGTFPTSATTSGTLPPCGAAALARGLRRGDRNDGVLREDPRRRH